VLSESQPGLMRDELFKLKILPKIDVPDEEVQRWYDNMDKEVQISILYTTDSSLCDSLYNAIQNGADFAAMARKYSEDQQSAMKGGDIGFRSYASLSKEFQDSVFNKPVGEVAIVKVLEGWDLAVVTDTREAERQPLEEIRDALISRIQAEKKARVQNEFYDELYDEANININEETAQFVYDKAASLYPDTIGGVPFRKNTFNPDDLAEYEQKMILATYKGGEVSLGEYLRQTARWSDQQRPPLNDIENLKKAIFNLKLIDILTNKAEELKLDETEDYKDARRFFKDQVLAAKMKDVVIKEESFVPEDEVVQYYQEHADDYVTPKKLHLLEVMLPSETEADQAYEKLTSGADFQKLAEKETTRPIATGSKGDLGYVSEYTYPTLYAEGSKLKVGEFSKPFPVGDNWSIVKLVDIKDKQVKLFDEVSKQIKTQLENTKKEQAISNWLADNKGKYKIKTDYDLIWETVDKSKYE
jgi:parvulin-like peptidyl-prolyl isomerase